MRLDSGLIKSEQKLPHELFKGGSRVQSDQGNTLYGRGGGPTCVHESLQVQCIDVIAVI